MTLFAVGLRVINGISRLENGARRCSIERDGEQSSIGGVWMNRWLGHARAAEPRLNGEAK